MQQDIQLTRRLFNVEEYYKMAETGILEENARVELINGEIITMSPINSQHSGIINFLNRALITTLGNQAIVSIQNPLRLNEYSEPEPDLLISKFREDAYRNAHPTPPDVLFLIEVSDSSLDFDRKVKTAIYAKSGIPEYWIINIPDKKIEIYTHPGDGEYLNRYIAKIGDTAKAGQVNFELPVADLFE